MIYKLPVSLAPVVPTIKCAEYLRDGPLVHFSVSIKTRNNGETLKMFPLSRISLISHIKWFHLLQRSNGSIYCKDQMNQMVPFIAKINGSIYCKDQMVPLIAKINGSIYCKDQWFHLLQRSMVPFIANIKWFHLLQRSNVSIYCNKIKWFHLLQ